MKSTISLSAIAAALSASPVAAQKLSTATASLDPLYYFYRQLMWVMVGVPVMLAVSMLPKPQARRFASYRALTMQLRILGSSAGGGPARPGWPPRGWW